MLEVKSEPVFRLIYVSRSLIDHKDNADRLRQIQHILRTAQERNLKNGITGALFFDGDHFGQVLEGPVEAVRLAMVNVGRDPRHTEIDIVSEVKDARRMFSDWSMAIVRNCDGPTIAVQLSDTNDENEPAWVVTPDQRALITEVCRLVEAAA
jgi:hypothetical protein